MNGLEQNATTVIFNQSISPGPFRHGPMPPNCLGSALNVTR
jgi:hypothetical protein